MQKNKIKNNKASALAVAMIILGLVLSIGLSASLISISNKKVSISSNKSNLAYSKAQSGIEAFLYKIKNAGTSDTIQTLDGSCSNGIINSSGGYKMEFKDEEGNYITNCSVEISEIRTIKSTGIVPGNNQRSIEAAVAAKEVVFIEPNSDIIILMDFSGSMDEEDVKKQKDAVIELIDKLGSGYRVGVAAFSKTSSNLKSFSLALISEKDKLKKFIENDLPSKGEGNTPMGGAIRWAREDLESGKNNRHGKSPQAIILITDGAPFENTWWVPNALNPSIQCSSASWDKEAAKKCLEEADLAKDKKISIFAISVGFNNYNEKCLVKVNDLMLKIVSKNEYYFPIDEIEKLDNILNKLSPSS